MKVTTCQRESHSTCNSTFWESRETMIKERKPLLSIGERDSALQKEGKV